MSSVQRQGERMEARFSCSRHQIVPSHLDEKSHLQSPMTAFPSDPSKKLQTASFAPSCPVRQDPPLYPGTASSPPFRTSPPGIHDLRRPPPTARYSSASSVF